MSLDIGPVYLPRPLDMLSPIEGMHLHGSRSESARALAGDTAPFGELVPRLGDPRLGRCGLDSGNRGRLGCVGSAKL